MKELRRNTAILLQIGPALDTDGIPVTGLASGTVDEIGVYKNGATSLTSISAAAINAIGSSGNYYTTFATGTVDTLGPLTFYMRDNDQCIPVFQDFMVLPEDVYDRKYGSGVAQAGGARTITLAATASATNYNYILYRIHIISGTGAGQSRLCVNYVGGSKVLTVDNTWVTNPDNTSVYYLEGGTLPVGVKSVGVALAGAANSITLGALTHNITDAYKDDIVVILSGTGGGQSRVMTALNSGTNVATVDKAWEVNPDSTSSYIIIAGGRKDLVNAPNATAITAIQAGLSTLTAAQVWAYVLDGTLTAKQAMQLCAIGDLNWTGDVGTVLDEAGDPVTTVDVDDDGNRTVDRTP